MSVTKMSRLKIKYCVYFKFVHSIQMTRIYLVVRSLNKLLTFLKTLFSSDKFIDDTIVSCTAVLFIFIYF